MRAGGKMKASAVIIFYALIVIAVTVIAITLFKTKRFFSAALLSVLQGVAALFAVNFAGSFFGVHIAVNPFSLAVSSVGGTSGVILLLISQVLFR
jgi:hypothetical protein